MTGTPAISSARFSSTGWWYFFPVVFLVKTPTAVLASLIVAILQIGKRLAAVSIAWFGLAIPAALYFAGCMTSHINLGVRHLLPFYPLLFALLGAALSKGLRRNGRPFALFTAAVFCLLAAESWTNFPNYTAFFNWTVGGSAAGPKYLLDSNIDWGQDAKKL